jgi:proline dehydrogenase
MNLLDRMVALSLPLVPRPIVGRFARSYIAGTGMQDAFRAVRDLSRQGAMATLDILGEFVSSEEEAAANTSAYVELVRNISGEGLPDTNVSVKLTSVGLLLDPGFCLANVRSILKAVERWDNFLRIDMEDSTCTEATLEVYRRLRAEFPERVGVVLQSMLRRSADDAADLCREKANIRLVKGIYVEPHDIAYRDPEIIRRSYTSMLDGMLSAGAYVGIATHDERLVFEALELIRKYGLRREQYEFQMLMGVQEPLRKILLDAGHRLRVYVPYGENWYAYSIRRLRDNPQIAGYAFRSMLRRR